jgi:hypothetical protein
MRVLALLLVLSSFAYGGEPEGLDVAKYGKWFEDAAAMDETAAAALEAKLAGEPSELEGHFKAAAYYFRHAYDGPAKERLDSEGEKWGVHYRWLVLHDPASKYFDYLRPLDQILFPWTYGLCGEAWDKVLKLHPQDARVLGNAADFFTLKDHEKAAGLLERAGRAEPEEAQWNSKLGHLYLLGRPVSLSAAAKALEQFELALGKISEAERPTAQLDAANAAWLAGQDAKAETFAMESLKHKPAWFDGHVQFEANRILGHLSLKQGKIADALAFLKKAGETQGSPLLGSFGPNFSLAQSLLAAGKGKEVAAFLKDVKKFWKNPQLDQWIAEIEKGGSPLLDRWAKPKASPKKH